MKPLFLVAILVALAGCVVVRPSDAARFEAQASNAAAFEAAVTADPAVSPAIKKWVASEAKSWRAVADWANGRNPTP